MSTMSLSHAFRRHGTNGHILPLVVAAYGAAYIGWLWLAGATDDLRSLVANAGYIPVGLLAAAVAYRISTHAAAPARARTGWRLLTIACLLTVAGDIWWTVDENVLRGDPSESWGNVLYVLYYVCLLAGLLQFPDALRTQKDALRYVLDAAIIFVGGTMLVWHLVMAPNLQAGGHSLFQLVIALSYPVGDLLVLLGLSFILLRCPGGRRYRPMMLLAGSVGAMLAGDLVWARMALRGEYAAGSLQDVFYMAQYVLFAAAASAEWRSLRGDVDMTVPADPWPMTLLPYGSVVAGYGLLLVVGWNDAGRDLFPLIIGAFVLTLLVVSRQFVAVRENLRLSRERAVLAGEARFRSLIQNTSDLVSIVDAEGRFTYVSPSVGQMLGHVAADLAGTPMLAIVHAEDRELAATRMADCRHEVGHAVTGRWRLQRQDGTWIPTDNVCTNLTHDASIGGVVLNTRDVSQQCALEAQLMHQAFHDPLTGLSNRALFEDRLRHALARRREDGRGLGVLFLDLDHFKTVNDSLGHAAGDAVLEQAAARLATCLRTGDTVARLGGDEFAVLVEGARDGELMALGDRIARVCQEPFWVDGRELLVSASVGIAAAAPGQSAQDLLRNADLAMYLAKNRGRGQAAVFEPSMHAAALARLELVADLRHALQRQELALLYQPIHDLVDGSLVGVEALLRWHHPVRGTLSPLTFVPVAQDTGQIVPIGRWVLERACQDGRIMQQLLPQRRPLRVAVNVSAHQIIDPALVHDIETVHATSALAPGTLVLELTEGTLFDHTEHVRSVMNRLRASGVRLAIDDFGTGYSSLSYLQRLPIDILKVDRSFVDVIDHDAGAAAVTDMIIGLGRSMALETVAEGIETASQARLLRQSGCDFGQGYFFSVPIPAHEVIEHARRSVAA